MIGANFKKTKNWPGFTLIETIVTVGVFIIVVVTVVDIFMIHSRAQNIALRKQKILNETNFLLDKIAQDVRLGELITAGSFNYGAGAINYYGLDGDAGISGREVELVLNDPDGNLIIYVFDSTGSLACPKYPAPGLYKYTNGICNQLLDLPAMAVTDAGFHLKISSGQQPLLTVYLSIEDRTDKVIRTYNLQTTASSRAYQ